MTACDVCCSWERPDLCAGVAGVASSSFGAFSVGQCREVLTRGLEPRWAPEALLGVSDPDHAQAWRAGLADWAVVRVEAALAFYGVSEEAFVAGIVEAGKAEDAYFARDAAVSAVEPAPSDFDPDDPDALAAYRADADAAMVARCVKRLGPDRADQVARALEEKLGWKVTQ